MSGESGIIHHHHEKGHHDDESDQFSAPPPPPPPIIAQYGTFEGVPPTTYSPAMGFPQPAPPRGALDPSHYYAHGYQAVPGYAVAEGTPIRERSHEHEHRLPCCGIGFGWFLFIIGFFIAGIPWYVGAFFLICCKRSVDQREKPGYVACTIAAVLAIIAIIFGATRIK